MDRSRTKDHPVEQRRLSETSSNNTVYEGAENVPPQTDDVLLPSGPSALLKTINSVFFNNRSAAADLPAFETAIIIVIAI